MTRLLTTIAFVCVWARCYAAVEAGQTWLLGAGTMLVRDGEQIAVRPCDRFEVLEVGEQSVFGRCTRGEQSVEGHIAASALAAALTDEQFEALRAAMTTYVYSDDEAARRAAAETIRRFQRAGFVLHEFAASRGGLLADDPPAGEQRIVVPLAGGRQGEYYLTLPPDYDASKTYPLIISFHGRGGTGTYGRHWSSGSGEAHRTCIIVAPTNPEPHQETWWDDPSSELILAALRATLRDYAVDPWRIYAEGFSMGGGASTFWAQTWPDQFAAIGSQAFAAWRNPRDRSGCAENMRRVPAFLAVGENDIPRFVDTYKRLDAELTRLGTPHVFKLLKNTGHAFAHHEDEMLVFFLKWQRNLYPRSLAYNDYRAPRGERVPEWVYWVRIREASHNGRIAAEVHGNTIQITTEQVRRFDVYLSDRLVDLDRPVSVMVNNAPAHSGPVTRDVFAMLDVIRETGDRARLFSAKVEVTRR
jgi:pimeloyl-ACP methyl ester carboxylesterase